MEAFLYETLEDEAVRCHLCNHQCKIKPGKRGICQVRENRSGTLETLVFDKLIARNVDPIEKKPLFHFLPGLLNAVRGHLRLVGVSTRTPDEIRSLPPDWRTLYLKAKAGLVTEALIVFGLSPDEDEIYSAEAFYSVSAGPLHDFKLLTRYFARLLRLAKGERAPTDAGNRGEGLEET